MENKPYTIAIAGKNPFTHERCGSKDTYRLLQVISSALESNMPVTLKLLEPKGLNGITPDTVIEEEASSISAQVWEGITFDPRLKARMAEFNKIEDKPQEPRTYDILDIITKG